MTEEKEEIPKIKYTEELFDKEIASRYRGELNRAQMYGKIEDWAITTLQTTPATDLKDIEKQVLEKYNAGDLRTVSTKTELIPLMEALEAGQIITAEQVSDVYIKKTKGFVDNALETITDAWNIPLRKLGVYLVEVLEGLGVLEGEELKELKQLAEKGDFAELFYIGFITFMSISHIAVAKVSAVNKKLERELNTKLRPDRPGFQDFLKQGLFDKNTDKRIKDLMGDAGIPEEYLPDYYNAVKTYFGLPEVLELFWREEIDPARLNLFMEKAGLTEEERELAKVFLERIAPVQDVIRFAVRDAFNETAVKDWGLDEDYPEKLTELGKKWGFTDETLHYYWRSHWQMPSPQFVYEFMHRRHITQNEAETLLRIADWPKKIRDLMMKTSYRVISRVDVRRIYKAGVMTEQEVLDTYLDMGYNERDARRLTDFVLITSQPGGFKLTKAEIINGYKDEILTRTETLGMLQAEGYTAEEAEFLLLRQDLQDKREDTKLVIDVTKRRYADGELTTDGVLNELGKMGVKTSKINRLIVKWDLQNKQKEKRPSDKMLEEWFTKGIIPENEARLEFSKNGWPEKYIDKIILNLKG
jgi:hypothetical protein